MIDLQKILPQNYPFLMIDRITAFEKGKSLTAIKNITANEWWEGNSQTFPETLIIEAAAQAALMLHRMSLIKEGENPKYILGKAEAEFKQTVHIGDVLQIQAFATKMLRKLGYSNIVLLIKNDLIAHLRIFYSVMD